MDHRDQHRETNGRFKGRTGAKYFVPARNPIEAWIERFGGVQGGQRRGNDPAPEVVQPAVKP